MKTAVFLALLLPIISSESISDVAPECQPWRLPRNVLPRHYDVQLDHMYTDSFHGSVRVDIDCIEKTNTITLHAKGISIQKNSVKVVPTSQPETAIRVVEIAYDREHYLVRLKLESVLTEGESYILDVTEFKGDTHGRDYEGLFKYLDWRNNGVVKVFNTFFEPANAREAFPCFDEPNMKATFSFKLGRSEKETTFSNMRINRTDELSDGTYLDIYEETPVMSTYNLGLIVSDFVTYPENGTTRTRIVIPKEEFNQIDLDITYQVANDALRELELYTDIPYPLSKLDHVGVDSYKYNGMEHWGFIVYARIILYRMNSTHAMRKQDAYNTVIHETAHQWFGNLVTLDWWSYFWLNEALPTYLQHVIGDKLNPSWRHYDQLIVSELQKALRYDGEREGEPALPLTIKNICDIDEIFEPLIGVSYEKGASVLRMFEGILGSPEYFQTALQNYLKDRMYKNAKPSHLFRALDEVNRQFTSSHLPEGVNFEFIGTQWTEQPGVPVVTVTRDYSSGAVQVKQHRFYYKSEGKNQTRWFIPLTWTTGYSDHYYVDGPQDWFYEDKILDVKVPADDWLLVNINSTGYYRVNYDEENWSLLAHALETSPERFSVANRAQLLDDAIQLNAAGLLDYNVALNLTRFLQREEDRIVWISAGKNLQDLYYQAAANDHENREYVKQLMTKGYNMVTKKEGETHLDKLMRENIEEFACAIDVPSCEFDFD